MVHSLAFSDQYFSRKDEENVAGYSRRYLSNVSLHALLFIRPLTFCIVFCIVAGFAFLAIFLGAVGSNTDPNAEGLTYLPRSYYYPPQTDDMRYATCSLTNIRGGFGSGALMFDYIGKVWHFWRPRSLV